MVFREENSVQLLVWGSKQEICKCHFRVRLGMTWPRIRSEIFSFVGGLCSKLSRQLKLIVLLMIMTPPKCLKGVTIPVTFSGKTFVDQAAAAVFDTCMKRLTHRDEISVDCQSFCLCISFTYICGPASSGDTSVLWNIHSDRLQWNI